MTEILTESFCERCGTRYTFESARPKARLKGVKVLSRGLKNFVLSDSTSIDEAMAAARSETEREATSHQLDAFHETFNFCMSCRQYTCPNCWNEPEVRCLSCAPLAVPEPAMTIGDLRLLRDAVVVDEPAWTNGAPLLVDEPWSGSHDALDGGAHEATEAIDTEVMEAEGPAAESPAPEALETVAADAETLEPAVADAGEKATAQTTGLLRRFRPGQSLDAELDAYERQRTDIQAAGEPPVAEEVAAEPVAMETEEPVDLAGAASGPVDAPPETTGPADVVEQPTWRITPPDAGGATAPAPTPDSGTVPLQANGSPADGAGGEPQWPARPQWPPATAAGGLPFLGRPAAPQGGIEALWAASNQEIVTAAPAPGRPSSGIQPCISCGLSLSATARFCRRCGTLQGR